FALLIARHGPMVLGTARRLVDNPHDAEDVFQAAFLSLARLAKTIRHGRTLPAWLHRTTARIAVKVRAKRPAAATPRQRGLPPLPPATWVLARTGPAVGTEPPNSQVLFNGSANDSYSGTDVGSYGTNHGGVTGSGLGTTTYSGHDSVIYSGTQSISYQVQANQMLGVYEAGRYANGS